MSEVRSDNVERLVRRKVEARRNSECASARLEDLDFENWWLDTSFGRVYLHVHKESDDTWHRVFCKCCDAPRLEMKHGWLKWLYTANVNVQGRVPETKDKL